MDAAHLHLVINHAPVIGTAFALLLFLYGWLRKGEEVQRAGLATFALTALISIPVYYSGEFSEEVVERLPGVSEALIDPHEAAAKLALIVILVLGAASLGLLFLYRRKAFPRWASLAVMLLALGAFGLMARTANLGGQIRHQEIRTGFTAPAGEGEGEVDEDHEESGRGRGRGRGGEERQR